MKQQAFGYSTMLRKPTAFLNTPKRGFVNYGQKAFRYLKLLK